MMLQYLYHYMTLLFIILSCILRYENVRATTTTRTTTEGGGSMSTGAAFVTHSTFEKIEMSSSGINNPTLEMMEFFIQHEQRLKDYLGGIENQVQRSIVETQIKFCPYVSFCKFNIGATTDKKSCCQSCQCENCEGTGTCCPSVLPVEMFNLTEVMNNTDNYSVDTFLRKFWTAKIKEPRCVSKHLTVRKHKRDNGFLAISDCPRNTGSVLQYNCSRPYKNDMTFESFLPVSSNTSLEIFRNKYCAVCNGIPEEDFVFFKPVFFCTGYADLVRTEKEITNFLFSNDECSLEFINADNRVIVSQCDYAISSCNVTGMWKKYEAHIELACHAYESVFTHEQYLFHNVFCAMCNGMDPHTITCQTDTSLVTEQFSFSGLLRLDFDDGFATSKDDKNVKGSSCTRNQIFDALMERCKDLTCPDMRRLQDGDCVNIYENIAYYFSYVINIRLEPVTPSRLIDAVDEMFYIFLHIDNLFQIELDICEVQMVFKSELKFGRSHPNAVAKSSLLFIDVRIMFTKSNMQRPWDIVDNLLKVHGRTLSIEGENNNTMEYVVYVHDRDDRLFKIIEELFDSTNIYRNVMRAPTAEDRITVLSEYGMTDTDGLTLLPFSIGNSYCTIVKKEIDVLRFSSCPKVSMSKLDITWTENSNGITVKDLNINSTEFYYIDQINIMICAEKFEQIMRRLQPQRVLDAELIVSIVSCSLSVMSLLFTLVTFCLFPKLRMPLPGKNNMSLITALLIAQVMLLVGSLSPYERYSLSCKAVGLLTHFGWLCSIFWMNVCTYHMFRVITETKALVVGQGTKRFLLYHIYVITMATVFVSANIISSLASSNGDFGYGGKFCYLTSQHRILYTFVLPTSLVILGNFLMFIFVIIKIKRSSSIQRSVKNDRNNLVILTKLSTITGLTWIFGFVYTWTNIKAFSYIFIVLNASQGIFIMFAFVINRRVLAMYKDLKVRSQDRIHLKTSNMKSSGRSTNSTTF